MEKVYQYIIFCRIKKILKDKRLATYKFKKEILVKKLGDYFWDKSKDLNGFWNKKIYKKQIALFEEAISKGHTKDSCRKDLSFENSRSDELITRLIDDKFLSADSDCPPNYYISKISVFRTWALFRWVVLNVVFLGLIVAISANWLSNYFMKF